MVRILLTGGAGFVGQALLRRLKEDGHDVVTIGRSVPSGQDVARHIASDILAASRSDLVGVMRESGATHLIHAAWYTNHADYLVADINRDWLEASTRLAEAFTEAGGQRIVGLGTCAEYAQEGGRCREYETKLAPWTLYGECKLELSRRFESFANATWARLFFIYGPGDRSGRLVPHLIERARAGETVSVRFGGLVRDYIHIDDLASQITAITVADVVGPINTGSGAAVSLSTIAEAAAQAAGRPDLAEPNDLTDDRQPPLIEADMARYRRDVGAFRCRTLLDGLTPLVQGDV